MLSLQVPICNIKIYEHKNKIVLSKTDYTTETYKTIIQQGETEIISGVPTFLGPWTSINTMINISIKSFRPFTRQLQK